MRTVKVTSLNTGDSTGCGCEARKKRTVHGQAIGGRLTRTYRSYAAAKNRCTNPNYPRFGDYGGRGIEFRLNSVQEVIDAIGPRPEGDYSIDRIDNDGHYEVTNIRWATRSQQQLTDWSVVYVTLNGKTQPLSSWCKSWRSVTPLSAHASTGV